MSASSTIKYGTATVILIVAVYIGLKRNSIEDELHQTVLESLRRAKNKVHPQPAKVAVGFGACLDIFVDALDLMNKLGIDPPNDAFHHQSIGNFNELAEGFVYFFRYGAAAERYFSNETLFKDIVKATYALDSFRTAAGGNAPVMANRLAIEGAEVMLGAQSNPDFMKKLWPGIISSGPDTENMDVHLIMEYKTGDKWGEYVSKRANRYIIHSDQFNPKLGSLEPFIEPYVSFKPNLLIVSGLQMMDNYPFKEGERGSRLSILKNFLKNPPGSTKPLVHFELASFVDGSLMSDLLSYVAPHVDSFGMNEQEIANLESALKYGNITIMTNPYPRVAAVLDQMRNSYKLLRENHGKVSRIHVHTLAFQAIMTEKRSKWKNTMSASAHASLTANRHVCGTKLVDVGRSKLLMDDSFSTTLGQSSDRISFQPKKPVSCWEEGYTFSDGIKDRVLICVAPNLVCTQVFQTVGGGDNISAAGLSVQI